ncbi:putative proteasome inhibitor [Arachis hypogaea]|nr:putative proteasome inhibitor [Arachis hypogaea]
MATDKSVMAVIRAARPSFLNDHDKAAFVVHATFLSSGYLLPATGSQAVSDDALSPPSTEEVSVENGNQLDQEYAFVYVNPEKVSNKVLGGENIILERVLSRGFLGITVIGYMKITAPVINNRLMPLFKNDETPIAEQVGLSYNPIATTRSTQSQWNNHYCGYYPGGYLKAQPGASGITTTTATTQASQSLTWSKWDEPQPLLLPRYLKHIFIQSQPWINIHLSHPA